MIESEIERVRAVYAHRFSHVDQRRYTPFDSAHRLLHISRQRALLDLLKRRGIYTLNGMRVLEVGCGAAGILLEYLDYGAKSTDLFGVDILTEDLRCGCDRSPNLRLFCADGQALPFADGSFDLVFEYTVLTSVLDAYARRRLALEMRRVAKATGLIVVYDFWPDNPDNPDVRGVTISEVKALFPGSHYDIQRIVLAPPIARRIAPISTLVCQILEKVPVFCTHYLIGVTPAQKDSLQYRTTLLAHPQEAASDGGVNIRPMVAADLPQVVEVHLQSFPGFFLSFLGPDFLRLLYRNIADHPEGVVLIASVGGRIEGFVAGVAHQSGFYQHLVRKEKWGFALAATKALIKRPAIAPRLVRALKQPESTREASAEACLMSIAVRPDSEGRGVGRQLVEAFCREFAVRGAPAISLTTDHDHNDHANRFYQKLGFQLGRAYVTPERRAINEYVLALVKED